MFYPSGPGGLAGTRYHPKVRHERHGKKPGGIVDLIPLGALAVVWVVASSGTGFLLALLARRVHPSLSLAKLWFFYTVLMALLVAFVFTLGWV